MKKSSILSIYFKEINNKKNILKNYGRKFVFL